MCLQDKSMAVSLMLNYVQQIGQLNKILFTSPLPLFFSFSLVLQIVTWKFPLILCQWTHPTPRAARRSYCRDWGPLKRSSYGHYGRAWTPAYTNSWTHTCTENAPDDFYFCKAPQICLDASSIFSHFARCFQSSSDARACIGLTSLLLFREPKFFCQRTFFRD